MKHNYTLTSLVLVRNDLGPPPNIGPHLADRIALDCAKNKEGVLLLTVWCSWEGPERYLIGGEI